MLGCHIDITRLKEAEERLRRSAMTDELTGLPNGRALRERCYEAILRAKRRDEHVAVLYFDLDKFKRINDNLGHEAGNTVLKVLAARARLTLRELDVIGRLHGDEFVVIAEGISSDDDASTLAHRILSAVSRPVDIDGVPQPVTVSIGVSLFPQHGRNFEELSGAADRAMLAAKREGRHTIHILSDSDGGSGNASVQEVEAELWGALARDELFFAYQPQRELTSGEIVGYEALMRWRSRSRLAIGPDIFLPLLSQIGMMASVTEWAINDTCLQIQQTAQRIAVNLSPEQLERPGLIELVRSMLRRTNIDPGKLEFELTEQRIAPNDERALLVIDELAGLGVGIALDDFGKGYSSFERLERLPPTKIKLDRTLSFRCGVLARSVRAIVQLAADRGVGLVAEGIETAVQRDELIGVGVKLGQGWLLGRPGALDRTE